MEEKVRIDELYGRNVFTVAKMKERLPKSVFKNVMSVMKNGGDLSLSDADVMAKAMKDWAMENGATHYTHWFQPLTGITAEKHDAFVGMPDEEGRMVTTFTGKDLIKGEPDASSFPSGGLRSTFEARGYTAWDVTSPAFLKEAGTGVTLCIPTAFYSYKGEALDKKTPLLRSMEAISRQALRIVRLFGDTESTRVTSSTGAEQEYFLVDANEYLQRTDLIFTGRTLFGAPAPKGQEMEDHYFGVIRERVGEFMKDLNAELWKLGVPAKTQHNEVAPGQHELAPVFEESNLATDHNQLIMETMKRVAEHHGLRVLLHEKPFAGVNGSGKHNNWSLTTDTGVNLLDPGETPERNIRFLLILSCIVKAVDVHADLLRQSASDVGNDLRLGANEAPPAIVSMFLGEQLDDVVRQLVETGIADRHIKGGMLRTGVSALPDIRKDATDRNRTSPFAFTGNKFEFRMVGSSDSMATSTTTLNAIVAEAFSDAADELEGAQDFDMAVHDLIKKNMTEHQRIIFEGNGYSKEWVEEAARRGLPNIPSTIEAVPSLTTDKAVKLFEKFHIFTQPELESRSEIIYENYAKTKNIEAMTMIDMAQKQILPACMKFVKAQAETITAAANAGVIFHNETEKLQKCVDRIDAAQEALDELQALVDKAQGITDAKEQSFYYKDTIDPAMERLRKPCDELETLVDKKAWPFPTYEDMLFEL
ncbi:MAG: glutamine synthetase III [Lachnospiraceae bacterium]|jgi:glutamine synthetase|nr:glutamine synthetase III [Lachnospiraceae bacterium]MCI1399070.1 glutamine synthetase III [Lachnospiraceae bacterium]MCI1422994.1 glutamine synthetase III [Lachnospiraceae bacterium]MCI1451792.1 glutamine synthetase III [Lachnospiraceae bacterium]